MTQLKELVFEVRSKNAGPFWLTIDIFCGSENAYRDVSERLQTASVAAAFDVAPQKLKRFDIEALFAIKFSLPRPVIQGSIRDRDMHGASYAQIIRQLEV
ncbi:DUF4387 family protein [Roseibium sp. RKSG952]|uniref:DUF4387 family protein n=1 Tax=Roseibium sp. RKSG952 TaxID=2529384 RepID=UPI0012BC69F4|nr:DUF4387 family protein [Roseibium sp. RKSG952]MTI00630.1 DUF4387 family protein [Roseibium sp. RKSG952]